MIKIAVITDKAYEKTLRGNLWLHSHDGRAHGVTTPDGTRHNPDWRVRDYWNDTYNCQQFLRRKSI